jgi:hypothetical protein
LNLLAKIDGIEGRYADARIQAAEALEIRQRMGDRQGIAASLHVLAKIDYAERRYADARIQEVAALRLAQELGDRRGVAASLNLLGDIARKIMQPKEAFDLMALSALIYTRIGHAAAQQLKNDLANFIAEQKYNEEQQKDLFQQVVEAYRRDNGIGLIARALERMQETNG